jgi:hypothetical protein
MTASSSLTSVPSGFSTQFDIYGNTSLEEAEVVCIADVPTDEKVRKDNADLINLIWKEHLVLIENIPFGTTQSVNFDELSRRIMVVSKVSGWDLPDLKLKAGNLQIRYELFCMNAKQIIEMLEAKNRSFFFNPASSFNNFYLLYLRSFYSSKQQLLDLYSSGTFDNFRARLLSSITQAKCQQQDEMRQLHEQTFQSRLTTLQQAISDSVIEKGKVIVCLSGNFVIRNPRLKGENYNITPLQEFLGKRKYVVINSKSSPLKIVDQPHLWGQAPLIPRAPAPTQNPSPLSRTISVPQLMNLLRLETMTGNAAPPAQNSDTSSSSIDPTLPDSREE